jgi:hypothetical protein
MMVLPGFQPILQDKHHNNRAHESRLPLYLLSASATTPNRQAGGRVDLQEVVPEERVPRPSSLRGKYRSTLLERVDAGDWQGIRRVDG